MHSPHSCIIEQERGYVSSKAEKLNSFKYLIDLKNLNIFKSV